MATKADEAAAAVERMLTRIDAAAADNGHTVEPWQVGQDDPDWIGSLRCSTCGRDAAVRARPDGSTWQAGTLRYERCR